MLVRESVDVQGVLCWEDQLSESLQAWHVGRGLACGGGWEAAGSWAAFCTLAHWSKV